MSYDLIDIKNKKILRLEEELEAATGIIASLMEELEREKTAHAIDKVRIDRVAAVLSLYKNIPDMVRLLKQIGFENG